MSLDVVKLLFSKRYGVSEGELSADSLISDVCTDSLEILELLMYIEDEFKVVFPDEVAQELKTLGDISAYIDENISDEALAEIAKRLEEN